MKPIWYLKITFNKTWRELLSWKRIALVFFPSNIAHHLTWRISRLSIQKHLFDSIKWLFWYERRPFQRQSIVIVLKMHFSFNKALFLGASVKCHFNFNNRASILSEFKSYLYTIFIPSASFILNKHIIIM